MPRCKVDQTIDEGDTTPGRRPDAGGLEHAGTHRRSARLPHGQPALLGRQHLPRRLRRRHRRPPRLEPGRFHRQPEADPGQRRRSTCSPPTARSSARTTPSSTPRSPASSPTPTWPTSAPAPSTGPCWTSGRKSWRKGNEISEVGEGVAPAERMEGVNLGGMLIGFVGLVDLGLRR